MLLNCENIIAILQPTMIARGKGAAGIDDVPDGWLDGCCYGMFGSKVRSVQIVDDRNGCAVSRYRNHS